MGNGSTNITIFKFTDLFVAHFSWANFRSQHDIECTCRSVLPLLCSGLCTACIQVTVDMSSCYHPPAQQFGLVPDLLPDARRFKDWSGVMFFVFKFILFFIFIYLFFWWGGVGVSQERKCSLPLTALVITHSNALVNLASRWKCRTTIQNLAFYLIDDEYNNL